jgi:hypothetical protein
VFPFGSITEVTLAVIRRFSRVRTARFRKFAGVAPRIETHHSGLSVDGGIRIVGQLKQVFQSYRMMFKELTKKEAVPHNSNSAKKRKTLNKILKHCFGRGRGHFSQHCQQNIA